MDISDLQDDVNARWEKQEANPCHGSDANHALVHMTKAIGKIAAAMNDAEHDRRSPIADEVAKYLADLVICASRFAYGSGVDLDEAVKQRLFEKFPSP